MTTRMQPILDALLMTVPQGWHGRQLYIGSRWTLAVIENGVGQQRAGLAATFASQRNIERSSFQWGDNPFKQDALEYLRYVNSTSAIETVIGFATLNAYLRPQPAQLAPLDAADWLMAHSHQRRVAIVGRFPFIEDEIRPFAKRVWIFELEPKPGEFGAADMAEILPQADIVAITSSTFLNHTLGEILALLNPATQVMLLGPTTPLVAELFDFGVNLLSGVIVEDIEATLASVEEGVSFSKIAGVRRVTLQKA